MSKTLPSLPLQEQSEIAKYKDAFSFEAPARFSEADPDNMFKFDPYLATVEKAGWYKRYELILCSNLSEDQDSCGSRGLRIIWVLHAGRSNWPSTREVTESCSHNASNTRYLPGSNEFDSVLTAIEQHHTALNDEDRASAKSNFVKALDSIVRNELQKDITRLQDLLTDELSQTASTGAEL